MRLRRDRNVAANRPVLGIFRNPFRRVIGIQPAARHSHEVARTVVATPRRAPYRAYVAATEAERRAAYRLRFRVFNLELNEGLDSAYTTGEDQDEFDAVCDHVIVEDSQTGHVVGTYRVQTGRAAA